MTSIASAPKAGKTLESKAVYRMRSAEGIGTHLRQAAIEGKDADALAVADMIIESSRPENIWFADDLHDKNGVVFSGYGSLNFANSRLDPAYMKACSSRARARTLRALSDYKAPVGEHMRFITFTVPPLFGFDFARSINLLDGALVLMKKRKWFKGKVSAAVFGDEITTGEKNTHFHCHSHMLGWTRKFGKMDILALRQEWTGCLKAVAKKMGVDDLTINTRDGLAVANVKNVAPKQRGSQSVTFESAIVETCKYTVKGTDFQKMSPEHLCQVERVLRGRRMVVTYGGFNKRKGTCGKGQYLDKTCTNDASELIPKDVGEIRKKEKKESLRQSGAQMIRDGKQELWLEQLRHKFEERREWRKWQLAKRYPAAIFQTLDGSVWYGVNHMKSRPLSVAPASVECFESFLAQRASA